MSRGERREEGSFTLNFVSLFSLMYIQRTRAKHSVSVKKEKILVIMLPILWRDTARRALRLCYFLAFPKK